MFLAKKVLQKVGQKIKGSGKKAISEGAVGKGVSAFRDYQRSKKPATAASSMSSSASAPKKIGSFDTGMDTNLRVPKVSQLGRGELFKTGM